MTICACSGLSAPVLAHDDPSREEVRESIYDDEAFDSKSIAPRGEDPPAMVHGFKDYPALLQRSKNTGAYNITQRLPGRPPLSPLDPLPVGAITSGRDDKGNENTAGVCQFGKTEIAFHDLVWHS